MTAAKKTVVVDVCSTWHGDIGGPEHLADYAKAAPGIRFLDMGEYYSDDTNSFYTKLPALKQMLPLPAIAPAVGLTAAAGHKNASCGGWPQCAYTRTSGSSVPAAAALAFSTAEPIVRFHRCITQKSGKMRRGSLRPSASPSCEIPRRPYLPPIRSCR